MRVVVEELKQRPVEELDVEIVERKGLGHPDYIADSSSEAVSRRLCQYYLEHYGTILHHNVDKGLVVGGRANVWFGGGEVVEPIYIIVAGRATSYVEREGKIEQIPVGTLAVEAIRDFIKHNFRFLDPDRHVIIDYKIKQGSVDLRAVFEAGEKVPLANDTSFGVAFAPLSATERLVLETEKLLNSPDFKKELPETGEDVKVMGLRKGKEVELTVAVAMISSLVPDKDHYFSVKEEVKDRILDLASKICDLPVEVCVNAADDPRRGIYYLTVTGTSAEHGDDGNTGRGNRIHGLITPCRYMSLEATAGKNPVNHVGKLYNVLAYRIAQRVYEEVKGVREVYVKALSRIGKPIDDPEIVDIQAILEPGTSISNVRAEATAIAEEEVRNVQKLTNLILKGEVSLF